MPVWDGKGFLLSQSFGSCQGQLHSINMVEGLFVHLKIRRIFGEVSHQTGNLDTSTSMSKLFRRNKYLGYYCKLFRGALTVFSIWDSFRKWNSKKEQGTFQNRTRGVHENPGDVNIVDPDEWIVPAPCWSTWYMDDAQCIISKEAWGLKWSVCVKRGENLSSIKLDLRMAHLTSNLKTFWPSKHLETLMVAEMDWEYGTFCSVVSLQLYKYIRFFGSVSNKSNCIMLHFIRAIGDGSTTEARTILFLWFCASRFWYLLNVPGVFDKLIKWEIKWTRKYKY